MRNDENLLYADKQPKALYYCLALVVITYASFAVYVGNIDLRITLGEARYQNLLPMFIGVILTIFFGYYYLAWPNRFKMDKEFLYYKNGFIPFWKKILLDQIQSVDRKTIKLRNKHGSSKKKYLILLMKDNSKIEIRWNSSELLFKLLSQKYKQNEMPLDE